MPIVLNGTTGITNDSGYTGDGVSFADSTPANTLVTTSGGNVGIGTSSPSRLLQLNSGLPILQFTNPTTGTTSNDGTLLYQNGANFTIEQQDSGFINVFTGGSERMRIDSSGRLLVGATSAGAFNTPSLQVFNADSAALFTSSSASDFGITAICMRTASGGGEQIRFCVNNSTSRVGHISSTSSSTSYNTSSDYRLKHDIAPMTGALARVAALKPVTYKWNVDDSSGEGFIAHELQEVVPDCVTGEKDAVDAEGNPQYQGIDTSFLVATLTAAIQEQQALINAQQAALESLTARVVALDARLTSLEGQPT